MYNKLIAIGNKYYFYPISRIQKEKNNFLNEKLLSVILYMIQIFYQTSIQFEFYRVKAADSAYRTWLVSTQLTATARTSIRLILKTISAEVTRVYTVKKNADVLRSIHLSDVGSNWESAFSGIQSYLGGTSSLEQRCINSYVYYVYLI